MSDSQRIPQRMPQRVRLLVVSDGSVPPAAGSETDTHTERVARLAARLAPDAEIGYASAGDLKARTLAADLRRMADGWDILAMPWSSPEPDAERLGVRRAFEEAARGPGMPLLVAAAGHDGPGRLRFPASCTSVLAVGVTGPDGTPTSYCGTDLVGRKPQLLVPDGAYPTESASGGFEPMRGTSAAVGVVAGWAARVLGRLREAAGVPPSALPRGAEGGAAPGVARGEEEPVPSGLLRAVLLAAAGPGGVLEGGPEDLETLAAQGAGVRVFALSGGALRLRVGEGERTRVAVVAESPEEVVSGAGRPLWLPPAAEVSVTGTERVSGTGWLVTEARGEATVECSGAAQVAVGGDAVAVTAEEAAVS
ncbi:S8/S53 family peptidase, partial [Streptomyces sp. NPDC046909]|uniref:S8/S53 family peptidase n=1 Tax=Streptomyces sp. NPDC046909 TaxID=3155617 RepID=UPI00340ADE7B